MGVTEKDPRDTSYIALYIAIKWYCDISSECALRIAHGQSSAKPGRKLTPEIFTEIQKITGSPSYKNINAAVKRFRVNKYDIFEAFAGKKNASEEAVIMPKIESKLREMSRHANDCPGVGCDDCALSSVPDDCVRTMCDILSYLSFDKDGKLVPSGNKAVHRKCTKSILSGETKPKSFKLYKNVIDELERYIATHKGEKIQDIASRALMEYVESRKT